MDGSNTKKTFLGVLGKIYSEFKYILYFFFIAMTCLLLIDFMLDNQQEVHVSLLGYVFPKLSVSLVCVITFLLGNLTGCCYAFIIRFRSNQGKKNYNTEK